MLALDESDPTGIATLRVTLLREAVHYYSRWLIPKSDSCSPKLPGTVKKHHEHSLPVSLHDWVSDMLQWPRSERSAFSLGFQEYLRIMS